MPDITTEIQDKNENMHNCQIRLSEENKSCVIEFEILIIKYWRIKFLDTYHPLFPKQTSHLKK